jgi:nicotinate-nucleotide pyrophosphorylase (carboxylating)
MISTELAQRLIEAGLDPDYVERVARLAIAEDLAGGVDVTSVATVPADQRAVADFVARDAGVVAGLVIAETVLALAGNGDVVVRRDVRDGDRVARGDVLLTATGRSRALLTAERTTLNLLSHLSGVATLTRRWVDAVATTGAVIRDTRKTTPGLRALEKYAVRCGGGANHRMALSDAALVKDNHIVAAGGVLQAFAAVRSVYPDVPVEVEVDSVEQCQLVVDAGADLVLLDNMTLADLERCVEIARGRSRTEASGGLTLDRARAVATTGVDYLAVGALTHSAPVLDIGCDFRQPASLSSGTAEDAVESAAGG